MKDKHSYKIIISGLPIGAHHFSFDIDDAFFAGFEESEVQYGKLNASVTINKGSIFLLTVQILGEVTVACDRCLDDLNIPITFKGTPIVKFEHDTENDETISDSEDILWVDPLKNDLDLSHYFYDSIILSLPLQRIHAEGKCDKKMMEKLKILQIND